MAERQENTNSMMSIIAIVLAVAALALAWAAFNRSGQDLGETIQREVDQFETQNGIDDIDQDTQPGQLPGITPDPDANQGTTPQTPGADPITTPGASPVLQ